MENRRKSKTQRKKEKELWSRPEHNCGEGACSASHRSRAAGPLGRGSGLHKKMDIRISVADPDPVPFWPLDPGGVKNQDPEPGWTSRIIFTLILWCESGSGIFLTLDPGLIRNTDPSTKNLIFSLKVKISFRTHSQGWFGSCLRPEKRQEQCSGSVLFSNGSGSAPLEVRILFFSPVAFKTPTKN
jgi:hypothetical protein